MPRITEEYTHLILEGSAAGVPDQLLQACTNPVLYWQESKPVALMEQLLTDFGVCGVFHISPGPAALAEAALRVGISYVGVTAKSTHAKWLGNVIDRVAMSHLATPGRPMHNKELATDVNAYFGDMLNQSKYNEDDREFCREQRSTIADAMVEMGNDEGHSINELFEYYLLALEDEIDKKHPRIIERKEVLRLALNMAFIDVFQIGPDFDNAM